MKRVLMSVMAAGTLTMAGFATAATVTATDAQQALAAAKTAMAKTSAVHYLWLSTPKIYKEAEAADKAGKYDEAVVKAKHAEELANLAYAQGKAQAKKYGVKLTDHGVQMD